MSTDKFREIMQDQMKTGNQSAGQEQLSVIRMRYCPEITEQIERDKVESQSMG